ncbi:unnamed protein product [Adineta ricciae]|uniref:Uncharacterized protein n=1 Tax=Adineta ricciae TaxID=249248 RepID=A0A814R0X2_ADIRI|nr:unnamed protein product [Adineta ricciae]
MFYTLINLFSYADSEERFNDLQTKLQELDVLHQSQKEHFRTTTPSSRDSGVPIRSSSSCCSLTSDSTSTPKSSLEHPFDSPTLPSPPPHTSVLQFYLHPPVNASHRHVSVHLDEEAANMSYIHETIPRYQSHGRNVHWNDKQLTIPSRRSASQHVFHDENQTSYYHSDTNILAKQGQRISLNASLPYQSKLNIRIHADRTSDDSSNNNLKQVKAVATIEPLDNPQYEQTHFDQLQQSYAEHYSTLLSNESALSSKTHSSVQQRESRRDTLPQHRQVSLPISLPIDQRLYLYIQNGEVLARC